MSIKVNERLIQIMGGRKNLIPVERDLEIGQDLELKLIGSIAEIVHLDNFDGTVDVVYKVKGIYSEEL